MYFLSQISLGKSASRFGVSSDNSLEIVDTVGLSVIPNDATVFCFSHLCLPPAFVARTNVIDLLYLKQRIPDVYNSELEIHERAIRTANVRVTGIDPVRLLGKKLVTNIISSMIHHVDMCVRKISADQLADYATNILPILKSVAVIEDAGIKVDLDRARAFLKTKAPEHELRVANSVLATDGYLRSRYDVVGTRTGRFKVASGFNFLGIPKGHVRELFVSRFNRGSICSLDYNAIDYRSIVSSCPELDALYRDSKDFHSRTKELLPFGELLTRDEIKNFTYACLYGGSDDTLAHSVPRYADKVASWRQEVEGILFAPVVSLRARLFAAARRLGYVKVDHAKIDILPDDHPGKILGLYAQTYSSHVFQKGLIAAVSFLRNRMSKIVFTVHDELIIDVHPDELGDLSTLRDTVEIASGGMSVVKLGLGNDYLQATS